MKAIKILLALIVAGSLMTACDTDIESKEIQKPYTYSPLYYQNLRQRPLDCIHVVCTVWRTELHGSSLCRSARLS